jgi:ribose transport system ATP-binding protein
LPHDVSLVVHAHEIVGLAGVMGAGRTELLSLYGAGPRSHWQGTIEVAKRPTRLTTIAAARRARLAFVTDVGTGAASSYAIASP